MFFKDSNCMHREKTFKSKDTQGSRIFQKPRNQLLKREDLGKKMMCSIRFIKEACKESSSRISF